MTLEQLRIFVAVAERQHVTQAAKALNLTQSAVSAAIAALEIRHGVRLLDRVGRGVALNETGRAFLSEAKAVLARAAAAEAALDDMAALRRGRLSIHASQTIASYWLPARLVAFHAAHPAVELDVRVGNTRDVADAVLDGTAELGFVEGVLDEPALSSEVVGSDELVVLVAPGHAWSCRKALKAADFPDSAWVLREPGSGTRSTLEAFLTAHGVDPATLDITMSLPSNEAVMAAAQAGAGAAALSRSVAEAAISAKRLVAAPIRLPARTFHLLRHKERYRTRAADAFGVVIRSS